MIIDAFLITGAIYLGFILLSVIGLSDIRRMTYVPKHKKRNKIVSYFEN